MSGALVLHRPLTGWVPTSSSQLPLHAPHVGGDGQQSIPPCVLTTRQLSACMLQQPRRTAGRVGIERRSDRSAPATAHAGTRTRTGSTPLHPRGTVAACAIQRLARQTSCHSPFCRCSAHHTGAFPATPYVCAPSSGDLPVASRSGERRWGSVGRGPHGQPHRCPPRMARCCSWTAARTARSWSPRSLTRSRSTCWDATSWWWTFPPNTHRVHVRCVPTPTALRAARPATCYRSPHHVTALLGASTVRAMGVRHPPTRLWVSPALAMRCRRSQRSSTASLHAGCVDDDQLMFGLEAKKYPHRNPIAS